MSEPRYVVVIAQQARGPDGTGTLASGGATGEGVQAARETLVGWIHMNRSVLAERGPTASDDTWRAPRTIERLISAIRAWTPIQLVSRWTYGCYEPSVEESAQQRFEQNRTDDEH